MGQIVLHSIFPRKTRPSSLLRNSWSDTVCLPFQISCSWAKWWIKHEKIDECWLETLNVSRPALSVVCCRFEERSRKVIWLIFSFSFGQIYGGLLASDSERMQPRKRGNFSFQSGNWHQAVWFWKWDIEVSASSVTTQTFISTRHVFL